MALTVGTDTYVDTPEAADYAVSMGLPLSGDVVAIEAALRRGTLWVDNAFHDRFPGSKSAGRSQDLEWPRAGAKDRSGSEISDTEIPREIARATVQAAVRELAAPFSLLPDVTIGTAKVLTDAGGPAWERVRKEADVEDFLPVLTVVEGILSGLIVPKRRASMSTAKTQRT
jgi:hypothetical protein